MTATDAMMKFRTTYLRAIARAWNDQAFLEDLERDPAGVLKKSFSYDLPWDVELEITSVDASESLWDPANAGGWVGRNAVISLWIPPPPNDDKEWSKAWAAYYDEFPCFLGSINKPKMDQQYSDPAPSLGESYPLGMGNWKDFLEFTAVVMRLIAVAWRDRQVEAELMKIDGKPVGVTILNKWMGFNMPWNMDVTFNMSGWDDNSPNHVLECRWKDGHWPRLVQNRRPRQCRNALKFYIPNCPAAMNAEPSIQAVALSAYNVTGDQYPFTCP